MSHNISSEYEDYDIRHGFITGNLIDDPTGIDVAASAQRYATQLAARLETRFPGALVSTPYENASGVLPSHLKTSVLDPEFEECDDLATIVDAIAGELYNCSDAWVVYTNA